jgi:hypothetical protein
VWYSGRKGRRGRKCRKWEERKVRQEGVSVGRGRKEKKGVQV